MVRIYQATRMDDCLIQGCFPVQMKVLNLCTILQLIDQIRNSTCPCNGMSLSVYLSIEIQYGSVCP